MLENISLILKKLDTSYSFALLSHDQGIFHELYSLLSDVIKELHTCMAEECLLTIFQLLHAGGKRWSICVLGQALQSYLPRAEANHFQVQLPEKKPHTYSWRQFLSSSPRPKELSHVMHMYSKSKAIVLQQIYTTPRSLQITSWTEGCKSACYIKASGTMSTLFSKLKYFRNLVQAKTWFSKTKSLLSSFSKATIHFRLQQACG